MRVPWFLLFFSFALSWVFGIFSIAGVSALLFLLWCGSEVCKRGIRELVRPPQILRILHFLYDFVIDLTVSNVVMAWDVLTPRDRHRASFIRVPIEDLSATEVILLSHRITLTPGTLACAVTEDERYLLVHAMYPAKEDMARKLRRSIDILKGNANDGF
jgi:multisubunit Na+/H+ antiporter MnhE subunit